MEQFEHCFEHTKELTCVPLLVLWGAGSGQILAHWQQEECKCDCCKNWGEEQSTAVRPRLLQSFSVSLMGQVMAFTGSIINAGKRPPPVCNYWMEMWKPYYRNSMAVEFLCHVRERRLPAVQMVKTTCTESKKKNMTSRDTEAPMGRNRACVESIVWIPAKQNKTKHQYENEWKVVNPRKMCCSYVSLTHKALTVVCVAVIETPRCRGVTIFILLLVLTIHV